MSAQKPVTSGAQRQRAFRDRMTRLGMTIPRIYMTEAEQELVRRFLRHVRGAHTDELVAHMDFNAMNDKWTLQALYGALASHAGESRQLAGLRLHQAPPSIEFHLRNYDDQPVSITVSEDEVHVSTPLCEQRSVQSPDAFNEACLRLGPVMPLSNVGLVGSHYVLFGQIPPHAPLANIVEELDVLGQNATLTMGELSHLIG
ncbi:MAG TPA: DUF2170 family protein [Pinirhizobacter sp.]|uniref:DUF2170 family protein n=1 Tax=Pinirhizobacter sp. TaxID=2950432 RepID=UPI002B6505E0|nr:DUF2170 family protein [Pinirhizobacter sp.]HMH67517.1 DUF2170 family protein [Pinirhizobacter sp.]